MLPVILSVLRVLHPLFNYCCNFAANKLTSGDLTNENIRQLVASDLNDIKTKLDGLAREKLLASVCFLEEGVCLLSMSLDQSNDNETEQTTSQATQFEAAINNSCSMSMTLSRAIAALPLNIVSQERFTAAKKCFEDARKKATEAFSNEGLDLEDRILATKLRVVSTLLERLQDPEAAVSSCKLFLEALHKMPAVQQMFSVYVNGGIKAFFNMTKRRENVKSVTMINVVLVNFMHRFLTRPHSLPNFAGIELDKRTYHPIWERYEILKEIEELGVEIPFPYKITLSFIKADSFLFGCSAVNSKGEIIIRSRKNCGVLNVIDSTGEIKTVCSLRDEDTRARGFMIVSLAVDVDDFVYVVTRFEEPNGGNTYKLYVFDDKFEIKTDTLLEFLREAGSWMSVAVSKDRKIFILEHCSGRVCVCGNDGRLEYSFSVVVEEVTRNLLTVSGKNEIIVATLYFKTVHVYSEDGKLKQTIELLAGYQVEGVAFHHVTERVIVYASRWMKSPYQYQLLSYSETGELQTLPLLHGCFMFGELTSHPCGLVALVLVKNMELGGQQGYFVSNFPTAASIPLMRTPSLREQSSRGEIFDRITSIFLSHPRLSRLHDFFKQYIP